MSHEIYENVEAKATRPPAATAKLLDNNTQPEIRRSTVPDILRPQKSFEKRYSSIINRQILETSINREVLQRQMNAFFPFSRTSSMTNEIGDGAAAAEDVDSDEASQADEAEPLSKSTEWCETEEESTKQTNAGHQKVPTETMRSLEKAATLDIANIK